MNIFMGMKVIESVWLVESGEPMDVRRTWRERLLSCRPWRATKTIVPQLPSKRMVQLNADTICIHPATLAELRRHRVAMGVDWGDGDGWSVERPSRSPLPGETSK